jgi:hypothetical protein
MSGISVRILLVIAAVVIGGGVFIWSGFYRTVDEPPPANPEADFRHGVLRNASTPEIPYWIWLMLPRIVPELLPGQGYTSLGIAWELGDELPIGFSKRTAGYPRVGANCALCHTAVVKGGEREDPKFVVVKKATSANLDGYVRFLNAAAVDGRFAAKPIMDELQYLYALSWPEKLLYRFWLIPSTRRAMRSLRSPGGAVHDKQSQDWPKLEMWIEDNATDR